MKTVYNQLDNDILIKLDHRIREQLNSNLRVHFLIELYHIPDFSSQIKLRLMSFFAYNTKWGINRNRK